MYGPCCPGKPVAKALLIGGQMVGIAELDAVIESVLDQTEASDEELKAILLAGIQKYNYIPAEMEEEYSAAVLEEFLKRRAKGCTCSCCGH